MKLHKISKITTLALCCFSVAALSASVPLVLESDISIDVPDGETTEYSSLNGDAYTLTKTGGGALVFGTISNSTARIVVSGGTLDVRTIVPAKPAILGSAWIHLDATDLSTMTYSETDGVIHVSEWRDVNGGSVKLTGLEGTTGWRGAAAYDPQRIPFLSPSFRNGRAVMDLGAIATKKTVDAGIGYGGGYFEFSSACSTMREAFLVVGDTEDAKRSNVDGYTPDGYAAGGRCNSLLGAASATSFLRGVLPADGSYNSCLLRDTTILGASKCDWTLNGTDVANKIGTILPDGLNLVEIRAEADSGISFNAIGRERAYYYGGLRYGELAIFDSPLSEPDREEVRAYLSARWLPMRIAGLELGEGSSLVLGSGVTLVPGSLKVSGAASVSGAGTLKAERIDRQGDGFLSYASASITARPDVAGGIPDASFSSDATITVVGTDAVGGRILMDGALEKRGSGMFAAYDVTGTVASVTVSEGTLRLDPLIAAFNPWMHLDASVTNSSSMTFADDNGTNVVTQWKCDGVVRAKQDTLNRAPMLKPGFQNGLSVLDFGELRIYSSTLDARGGYMEWNASCSNIRDVFTVASDTEDLDSRFSTNYAANATIGLRGAPFVGASSSTYGAKFIRQNRPANGSTRPGILNTSVAINGTAKCTLDGKSKSNQAEYPAGFHVLNIKTGQDTYGDAFANERGSVTGGTRIGEFILFTNEVPDSVRLSLNNGLMSKWLGGDKTLVLEVGDVSVAKGATLEVPYQILAPTGDVSVAGSLDVGGLRLSGAASLAATASFSGDLELEDAAQIVFPSNVVEIGSTAFSVKKLKLDGGTVDVSFAEGLPKTGDNTTVKLVSASSVEGTATFRTNEPPNKMKVRVFAESDGIYATFSAVKGLSIIVR